MYVVRLDGVGLDYSPTRLCLGLFFLSMLEMMMIRRRMMIIRKVMRLNIFLSVVTTINMNYKLISIYLIQRDILLILIIMFAIPALLVKRVRLFALS